MAKDKQFIKCLLSISQRHGDEHEIKVAVKSLFDDYVFEAEKTYREESNILDCVRSDVGKIRDLLVFEVNKHYPGQIGRMIEYAYDLARAF